MSLVRAQSEEIIFLIFFKYNIVINLKNNNFSFLFYDYETFGIHPALDKPAQFACIKTDFDLNIIQDPICLYCYPSNDYLPNPESILLTGITPQYTIKYGMNEFFFSKKIFKILNINNMCIIGYNNIKFDDEITRNIFYRNFLDPYSWSWKNGNSRWDLIQIIQACYILSPNNILWPKNKLGYISFKLEDLTKINNIKHNSHDALSDVYATIDLARLIKKKKPELFDFLFKYRLKKNIKNLIDIQNYIPLIYIVNFFNKLKNNLICILPILWDSNNPNNLLFFNLHMDVDLLIKYLYKTKIHNINIQTLYKLGINFLKINKCPILVPIDFFNKNKLTKLNINLDLFLKKIDILQKEKLIFNKIKKFLKNYTYNNITNNVDLKIYHSFFSEKDKNIMKKIQTIKINFWKKINVNFLNKNLEEIFFRLKARNFPNLLKENEKKIWFNYRKKIFNLSNLNEYFIKLNQLLEIYRYNVKKYNLLIDLKKYVYSIII
ncbi:exodeoxyribonuclease I [Buchnera aphidicola]|uniref:Exodeoxyribonuclease I n=1 Tax=Buchnera aphidicola (Therioaphis trifolii) TaxID=1241884 RepID=A0A4D6YKQ7_9GAMM|nr:exodeoxyribonuclease I [Buchnera aphidicola]QCI27361.1 exodeoxyribonuclease I [Buchnera aphidicola (Therioaphis trifolii)]